MVDNWKHPQKKVRVALVGKYVSLHDAYISVVESLKHAGVAHRADVEIKWVDSELVTKENVAEILGDVSGILVPGGFGDRGYDRGNYLCTGEQDSIPWLMSWYAAYHRGIRKKCCRLSGCEQLRVQP